MSETTPAAPGEHGGATATGIGGPEEPSEPLPAEPELVSTPAGPGGKRVLPMRMEYRIMLGIAVFFLVITVGYFLWSGPEVDQATGTVLLFFCVVFGGLPGGYLLFRAGRMGGLRPEDRPDARISEGSGTVGAFPDSSVWPVVIGFGAALMMIGFVFPFWLAIIGGSLLIGALGGVIVESRRGGSV